MFKGILFSSYRTLGKILKKLLEESEHEYSAEEIEKLLHVKPNDPLLELIRKKAVHNEKVSGIYLYFSNNHTIKKQQILMRNQAGEGFELCEMSPKVLTNKLKGSNYDLKNLNIRYHTVNPSWNYTISPTM